MNSRLICALFTFTATLAAQSSTPAPASTGSGLQLAAPAPLPEKPAPLPAPSQPARPSTLVLKPAADPLHLVEEPEFDVTSDEWRTARRMKVDAVSHNADGIAIQGYDVLSFLDKDPQKGKPELSVTHAGVTWLFATAEHREQFLQDPDKFIPAFGGFCAYSAAQGYPATADPRAFAVLSGKLYLFFDKAVQKVWEQDQARLIGRAGRNWPRLHR
jgi:YHS domain-containing protein